MITVTHGILAFWFNKFLNQRLKTRINPLYIIIGAILPDIFYILNWILVKIGGEVWHQESLMNASKFLHSLPIATVAFVIFSFFVSLFLKREVYFRYKNFFYGWWVFHILLDIFTHKSEGWPYFWPWLNWKLSGLVSFNDPLFWILEAIVSSIFLVTLLAKLPKGWFKK